MDKFEKKETIMFSLKNGEILFGILERYPDVTHRYWYITAPEDTSLIAIPEDSIITVTRPSEQYLREMAEAMQRIVQVNPENKEGGENEQAG